MLRSCRWYLHHWNSRNLHSCTFHRQLAIKLYAPSCFLGLGLCTLLPHFPSPQLINSPPLGVAEPGASRVEQPVDHSVTFPRERALCTSLQARRAVGPTSLQKYSNAFLLHFIVDKMPKTGVAGDSITPATSSLMRD